MLLNGAPAGLACEKLEQGVKLTTAAERNSPKNNFFMGYLRFKSIVFNLLQKI